MGDQAGATLQNYNSELVNVSGCGPPQQPPLYPCDSLTIRAHAHRQCIEELRGKREELNKSIATDEEEKGAQPPPPSPMRRVRPAP